MSPSIIFALALLETLALGAFLFGYFASIGWLLLLGGVFVVLDDVISILLGVLNPIFPIGFAVLLSFFFTPWYVGVFWASAGFSLLDLPSNLVKIFAPGRVTVATSKPPWMDSA